MHFPPMMGGKFLPWGGSKIAFGGEVFPPMGEGVGGKFFLLPPIVGGK